MEKQKIKNQFTVKFDYQLYNRLASDYKDACQKQASNYSYTDFLQSVWDTKTNNWCDGVFTTNNVFLAEILLKMLDAERKRLQRVFLNLKTDTVFNLRFNEKFVSIEFFSDKRCLTIAELFDLLNAIDKKNRENLSPYLMQKYVAFFRKYEKTPKFFQFFDSVYSCTTFKAEKITDLIKYISNKLNSNDVFAELNQYIYCIQTFINKYAEIQLDKLKAKREKEKENKNKIADSILNAKVNADVVKKIKASDVDSH